MNDRSAADLERLIRDTVASLRLPVPPPRPDATACPCHGGPRAACPDAVAAHLRAGEWAPLIDQTWLRPDASRDDIQRVCREAAATGFAAVCISPTWVGEACQRLRETPVHVCTVVGFPTGASASVVKAFEAARAVGDGAHEIDMVMNLGALKSRELGRVLDDVRGVIDVCRPAACTSKVIIECGALDREETIAATAVVRAAGADYVKTSTGFGARGATVEDVRLIRAVVGFELGVKAAGGIRSLAAARTLIQAGASRIGTSAGLHIVAEAKPRGEERDGMERATGIEPV